MKAKSVWAKKRNLLSGLAKKTFDIEIGVWSVALTDRSSELKNDPIVVALKKIIVEQLLRKTILVYGQIQTRLLHWLSQDSIFQLKLNARLVQPI